MYRTVACRLRDLKARTGYGGLAGYPGISEFAIDISDEVSDLIFGGLSPFLPPLNFPMEDVKLPTPLPDYVESGKTKITTLPNCLKIASETSAFPAAAIGFYIDCGSIYETPASYGVTHLLERIAFKRTTKRTNWHIAREINAIGGDMTASASREHMSYTCHALNTFVPHMVELLIDCVRNPVFLDWEVSEQINKVRAEIIQYSRNPQHLLLEAIHSTGYSGPHANALVPSESALRRLNSTVLEKFFAENYTAPRIVLAASGVDHDKLLEYAGPLLSDVPNFPRPSEPKPIYTGGDFRHQSDTGITHFALAFKLSVGWVKEKGAMILTVLQMLMGGDGSLSAGGPGKGMYSRSYHSVMNDHPQIQSFSAFNSFYKHTGLFGIRAATGSGFATTAIDFAVKELIAFASPGGVGQVQLERAKRLTKHAILMNSESRMLALEDMGKQILTFGERKPVEHLLKVVDEVSAEDIAMTVQELLSCPLTMVSYGDVVQLPSYDALSSRFRSG